MSNELKTPKQGASQRLRELYGKLRNQTKRPQSDKPEVATPEKKSAKPNQDPDLGI